MECGLTVKISFFTKYLYLLRYDKFVMRKDVSNQLGIYSYVSKMIHLEKFENTEENN